jgi:hypothetical protein
MAGLMKGLIPFPFLQPLLLFLSLIFPSFSPHSSFSFQWTSWSMGGLSPKMQKITHVLSNIYLEPSISLPPTVQMHRIPEIPEMPQMPGMPQMPRMPLISDSTVGDR